MPLPALSHAPSAARVSCGLKTAGRWGDTMAMPSIHTRRGSCPKCGVYDTRLLSDVEGRQEFRCAQCGESFVHPREVNSPP